MGPRKSTRSSAAIKPASTHDETLQSAKKGKSKVEKPKARKMVKSIAKANGVTKSLAKPRSSKPKTPKIVLNNAPTTRLNVLVCGDGSAGELGLGTKNAIDVARPRLNKNLDASTVGVVSLAAGGMHAAALTFDSKVLTWGVNDHKALGRDTTWSGGLKDVDAEDDDDSDDSESDLNPREATPTAIPTDKFPTGTQIVQITAGNSATFALTQDGFVYGWGTFRVSFPLFHGMCNVETNDL
jgi:regulator of chromosome condensation